MKEHYNKVIEKLKEKHRVERYYGQTLYKVTKDGFIYLRFSSKDESGKQKYFFGLDSDALNFVKGYEFCVIFVCGLDYTVFIIPDYDILDIIGGVEAKGNQWKVNIFRQNNEWFLKVTGKDRIEISKYLENYEHIFSKIIYREQIEPNAEEIVIKDTDFNEISYSDTLKKRIAIFSTKSDEPNLFEETIAELFSFLGFDCIHLGVSGSTDVLVQKPFKMIIEAKSSTKDAIQKIYFTRLKQHKIKHEADYTVVIAKDFAPSVIRDASIGESTLLPTSVLIKILEINSKFPLSPWDMEEIFKIKGLVTDEHLKYISVYFDEISTKIRNLNIIVESLDANERNADEFYGRYQLKCEELDFDYFNKKEFVAAIEFLSLPFNKVIIKSGDLYKKIIDNNVAKSRLKTIGGLYGSQ